MKKMTPSRLKTEKKKRIAIIKYNTQKKKGVFSKAVDMVKNLVS